MDTCSRSVCKRSTCGVDIVGQAVGASLDHPTFSEAHDAHFPHRTEFTIGGKIFV